MVTFNFSITDDAADAILGLDDSTNLTHIPGTVTGTLELEDNTNDQTPSSVVITSAPTDLGIDAIGIDIVNNPPGFLEITGNFDVSGGVVTADNVLIDFDDTDVEVINLAFNSTLNTTTNVNALTNNGESAAVFDDIGVTGNTDGASGTTFNPAITNTAPTITTSDTVSVEENQTDVIDINADDDNDSEGAGLSYSLTGGEDQGLFNLDASTGVLTFAAAPDFENPGDANGDNDYLAQVTVTDSEGLTDVQDITVTVTDVAENTAPTITTPDTVNVEENQTNAIDINASDDTDSEGSGLTYSLTGGADQALFNLDTSTGVLTFAAAPDFENPGDANGDNDYLAQVTVTDSAGLTDVQDITVSVTDIAENTAPTITTPNTVSVEENQTDVIDINADDDNDSEGSGLSYSLTGGEDQGLFNLDSDTGVLTFANPPDFENPGDADANNDYLAQVTVTDSEGLTDVQDLTVSVTDVAENTAPNITTPDTVSVEENQTAVIDINADDDADSEGAGLSYSLTGGEDQGLFNLDSDTGVLTFANAPDFENPGDADANNDYLAQVTVTDSAGLTDVQDLTVNVTDVVENTAPTITTSDIVSVEENQTNAIDINAGDDTDSEGSGLTYSLTGGADQALFNLDASTGFLTFAAAPDFENPGDANGDNDYLAQVTVTDSEGLTDVQDITVTVTDVVEDDGSINGTEFNDGLTGTSDPDTINGLGGNDLIRGLGGNDLLNGDAGNDTLRGLAGNDTLNGGTGDDLLQGGSLNDLLEGGEGQDTLNGGSGNDVLDAGIGNDVLFGGNGNDVLAGGADNDLLVGNEGNDTLRGNEGNDTLRGNEGIDTFVLAAGEGTDVIRDFSGGADVIGLADGLTFADLSFSGNAINFGTETIANLTGVDTTTLNESDFTII